MTTTDYNGWTNYATWGVALVLDNDEGTYMIMRERVAELRREEFPRVAVADFVKDFTEELCGLDGDDLGLPEPSMMARQVIAAGLAEVNWDELADHYLREEA